jgi:membrane-bound inhibitor of C-type lysozyme
MYRRSQHISSFYGVRSKLPMQLSLRNGVVLVGLVSLTLVGCNTATPEAETPPPETPDTEETSAMDATASVATFQCPDGETIEADFTNAEAAVVTLPDQEPLTLPRVEAASGAQYSDGTTTFWNKGDQAMVEVDGETVLSDCVAQ